MNQLPGTWTLIEEFEGNYIYVNVPETHQVSISYTPQLTYPYSIEFCQTSGDFIIIGFEQGAYATHAITEEEAMVKAVEMMEFIDERV